MAIPGGETPQKNVPADRPDGAAAYGLGRVHFFWTDERNVPRTHSESNYRRCATFFSTRSRSPPRISIASRPSFRRPKKSCEEYERELRSFSSNGPPRFDLVYLGLGKDGHTASLFADSVPTPAAILDQENWAAAFWVPQLDAFRFSLTPRAINAAAEVIFAVSGPEKAEILQAVLEGNSGSYPARLIAPSQGRLVWLADRPAAAQIDVSYAANPPMALRRIANQLRIHSIRSTTIAGSGHPTSVLFGGGYRGRAVFLQDAL